MSAARAAAVRGCRALVRTLCRPRSVAGLNGAPIICNDVALGIMLVAVISITHARQPAPERHQGTTAKLAVFSEAPKPIHEFRHFSLLLNRAALTSVDNNIRSVHKACERAAQKTNH